MKVFKSFYSHSKRSIYLFLILGLITNCSSSEKGPKPNAMLRNFGITEKDASPRAIELNSGEFIDKPPEYDVLTRLCTKGKPRVNKTQTLSVRLPDPGNVPLDQASKFRREYLEKAEYLAKHFFNLASSRNPPPPYVPDGRFGPYDVEHKPWVNNSEYFNSDDRHLRSNMAFHAILGGQYWELPLVYLMMGKFWILPNIVSYFKYEQITANQDPEKGGRLLRMSPREYDDDRRPGPQIGLLRVNNENPQPAWISHHGENVKAKIIPLTPIYDLDLWRLRKDYVLAVPKNVQKKVHFSWSAIQCEDTNQDLCPTGLLVNAEYYWDRFFHSFSTVKKEDLSSGPRFEVSLDLSLACQFSRKKSDLMSRSSKESKK